MGGQTLCVVWREACCNRYWELMNGLAEAGRAVSKSGTLKVAVLCEMCRNDLAVGEEATAFTVDGGTDHVPWEGDYLELDSESGSEVCGVKEGVWVTR